MAHTDTHNRPMLIATFRNTDQAERAHEVITERGGYTEKSVSVLMSKKTRGEYFGEGERYETKKGNKAPEGAGIGGALGGTAGGIAGALAAVGSSVAIPGLGLVIAGPLAAALAGAGAGGGAGSLIGGLIGAGISEERAKRYKSDIQDGGVVLGVVPRNREDADYIEDQWSRVGAERVYYESGGAWALFKAQLLETYDGLKSGELEEYRTDRDGLETYVHQRTGTPQREVAATVDEAASDLNYGFAPPASLTSETTSSGSAETAAAASAAAESARASADSAQAAADSAQTSTDPERTAERTTKTEGTTASSATSKEIATPHEHAASSETSSSEMSSETSRAGASAASSTEETTHQAQGGWTAFKGRVQETYGDLTDDEVERYKGQRKQLIGHIQKKTGAPHSDVQTAVDNAASETHYSFRSAGKDAR